MPLRAVSRRPGTALPVAVSMFLPIVLSIAPALSAAAPAPIHASAPVILGEEGTPLRTRSTRLLSASGARVRWSILSGQGTLFPQEGPTTEVRAGGLWGPLVVRAEREEDPSSAAEITLDVVLPPTEVQESEVVFQPMVRRVREEGLLGAGAATLAFEGSPPELQGLRPGEVLLLEHAEGALEAREVEAVQTYKAADAPATLAHLRAHRSLPPLAGLAPPDAEADATLVATLAPSPKTIFKSIHHKSSMRLDLDTLLKEPGWEKFRRLLPAQVRISSPLAQGKEGGITFAFDGLRILEWQGRTLSFSGSITVSGAIEHATEVDMDSPRGYTEQRIALRVAYQGALVAGIQDFRWPREGGYYRLLPVPVAIPVPLGGATLTLRLLPFYLKAKGWLTAEMDLDGELEVDQVIRKDLATGEVSLHGPGFHWAKRARLSLSAEGSMRMFVGFFPLEVGLGFAGIDFAGFACPTGVRASLLGSVRTSVDGTDRGKDGCVSLAWETECLAYLRFPSSLFTWFDPESWGFHKVTLLFHSLPLTGRAKDCLEDRDAPGPLHLHGSPLPRFLPVETPEILGGAWIEGRTGQPVRLVALAGEAADDLLWTQVDGPCRVPLGDPTGPEVSFIPPLPGLYSFQVLAQDGDLLGRTVDVRVLEAEP